MGNMTGNNVVALTTQDCHDIFWKVKKPAVRASGRKRNATSCQCEKGSVWICVLLIGCVGRSGNPNFWWLPIWFWNSSTEELNNEHWFAVDVRNVFMFSLEIRKFTRVHSVSSWHLIQIQLLFVPWRFFLPSSFMSRIIVCRWLFPLDTLRWEF